MSGFGSKLFGIDQFGSKSEQSLFQHDHFPESTGGVVFTHPLVSRVPFTVPALNPDLGAEMAINGAFGGTPDKIHDGLDSVLWTGSNVTGTKATFNSTDEFNSGAQSVKIDNPNLSDAWDFSKGSNVTITSYVALTMYVNITSAWTSGDSVDICAWDSGTAAIVGNKVLLENHADVFNFNVWQKVSLTFEELGLSTGTFDTIRMSQVAKEGKAATFYIDDLQVEETGGATCFVVKPPPVTLFRVHNFRYTIIDNVASTLLNASMPALSYDSLLGVASLDSGIIFSRVSKGEILGRAIIRNLGSAVKAGAQIINHMSDGTNTSITILREFVEPIELSATGLDEIRIEIADDLSTLISLTAVATGTFEDE